MKWLVSSLLAVAILGVWFGCSRRPPVAVAEDGSGSGSASAGPVIDHDVVAVDGAVVDLAQYRGSALLIVNIASRCGYTRQLDGLQELYTRYHERGFEVLGFPCNDFGGQAPGTGQEQQTFCSNEYGVTFPVFEHVSITGDAPSPLYDALQNETSAPIAGEVRWNFTKFLISPDGQVVARFEPGVEPLDAELVNAIEAQLPH